MKIFFTLLLLIALVAFSISRFPSFEDEISTSQLEFEPGYLKSDMEPDFSY